MNEQDRLKLLADFEQYQERCDNNYETCFKLYKNGLFLREYLENYQLDDKAKDLISQVELLIEGLQLRMENINYSENEIEKIIMEYIQSQNQTPENKIEGGEK